MLQYVFYILLVESGKCLKAFSLYLDIISAGDAKNTLYKSEVGYEKRAILWSKN